MTQTVSEYMMIEYRPEQAAPVNAYEMNAYNVPFAGNTGSCREIFDNGQRILEYSVEADISMARLMKKPVFRDEMIEYIFSVSRQLVSMKQNGLYADKVLWNPAYMYVRFSDFSVQLLYLPLDGSFERVSIGNFIRKLLSEFEYGHTSAIECANQIADYFDEHKDFDVFHFNTFVSELRKGSQLLTIQGEKGNSGVLAVPKDNERENAISSAQEAAERARQAKTKAENEAQRHTREAKYQAELARQAEEARVKAEAARVESEIMRQKAAAEVRDYEQTAILTSYNGYDGVTDTQANGYSDEELFRAEEMYRNAEAARQKAEKMSAQYADEIRLAREQEMRAEEARVQAEFAARKDVEEARRQGEAAKRHEEEAMRLSELAVEEPPTTLAGGKTLVSSERPTLTRIGTGECVRINKQVFCIGKADQGVDFKITGNKSISRRHAYITSINGVNYLRDNNSTNHTYLNGRMIYSNVDVVIPDNSVIRLSNEDFMFRSGKNV